MTFALFGFADLVAILVFGGVVAHMIVRPTHRGRPLLSARTVELNPVDSVRKPAVLIVADQRGFAAWLLRLFRKEPVTYLEVGPALSYHIGSVYHPDTGTIPLTEITEANVKPWHPMFHFGAMGLFGFPMLTWAITGELTRRGFFQGFALIVLFSALAAVQHTYDLMIHFNGRRKPLVFPFSTLSLGAPRPALTYEELCEIADWIMRTREHLAKTARAPEEKRTRDLASLGRFLLRMFGGRGRG
jgi:hypothetical protein